MSSLAQLFRSVRQQTTELCDPLCAEDFVVQSMPDASPAKWHLAHTTWFFETFLLNTFEAKETYFNEHYTFLFNSYYNAVGPLFRRTHRGHLSRPTVADIREYRKHVDARMLNLLSTRDGDESVAGLVTLGLHHEQQHQELLLTDIKHMLAQNPMLPSYLTFPLPRAKEVEPKWVGFEGGLKKIGTDSAPFSFDNESPQHQVWLEDFSLSSELTTNRAYLEFIEAGGYQTPSYWLSDGWQCVQDEAWTAPLYWFQKNDEWFEFTLAGALPLDLNAPVSHVSHFEADAYAAFRSARLPSEAEWETAAASFDVDSTRGHQLEDNVLHATGKDTHRTPIAHLLGEVWEWTKSAYLPYPGYRPAEGALGEYNGKFMNGQSVLRGGSCVTPRDHIRTTYRNFFPSNKRWQFSGIRLAKDSV